MTMARIMPVSSGLKNTITPADATTPSKPLTTGWTGTPETV